MDFFFFLGGGGGGGGGIQHVGYSYKRQNITQKGFNLQLSIVYRNH